MKTTIAIADPHDIYKNALKIFLQDYEIVGEASDEISAFELVEKTKPDILILDHSIGTSIIKKIRLCHSVIKIIIVSFEKFPEYVRTAFNAGADGYLLKDDNLSTFRSAISSVLKNIKYISPQSI